MLYVICKNFKEIYRKIDNKISDFRDKMENVNKAF